MTSREPWCRPTSAGQRSKELANALTSADGVREVPLRHTRRSSAEASSRPTAAKMATLARRPHRTRPTPAHPVRACCLCDAARASSRRGAVSAGSALRRRLTELHMIGLIVAQLPPRPWSRGHRQGDHADVDAIAEHCVDLVTAGFIEPPTPALTSRGGHGRLLR